MLLHSLGDDQVLFLGRNSSRFFSAKDLGVGRGNCIYFTNEYEIPWSNEWDIKEFQHHKGSEIEDWVTRIRRIFMAMPNGVTGHLFG